MSKNTKMQTDDPAEREKWFKYYKNVALKDPKKAQYMDLEAIIRKGIRPDMRLIGKQIRAENGNINIDKIKKDKIYSLAMSGALTMDNGKNVLEVCKELDQLHINTNYNTKTKEEVMKPKKKVSKVNKKKITVVEEVGSDSDDEDIAAKYEALLKKKIKRKVKSKKTLYVSDSDSNSEQSEDDIVDEYIEPPPKKKGKAPAEEYISDSDE